MEASQFHGVLYRSASVSYLTLWREVALNYLRDKARSSMAGIDGVVVKGTISFEPRDARQPDDGGSESWLRLAVSTGEQQSLRFQVLEKTVDQRVLPYALDYDGEQFAPNTRFPRVRIDCLNIGLLASAIVSGVPVQQNISGSRLGGVDCDHIRKYDPRTITELVFKAKTTKEGLHLDVEGQLLNPPDLTTPQTWYPSPQSFRLTCKVPWNPLPVLFGNHFGTLHAHKQFNVE